MGLHILTFVWSSFTPIQLKIFACKLSLILSTDVESLLRNWLDQTQLMSDKLHGLRVVFGMPKYFINDLVICAFYKCQIFLGGDLFKRQPLNN